jgi:hypothetical protein
MTFGDYTDEALRFPEAKRNTRDMALNLVRDHSCNLWSPSQKVLRCDWMELAGHRAPTLSLLLQHNALPPGIKFVGVDFNKEIIDGCKEHFGTDAPAEWINGSLQSILNRTSYANTIARVGVLIYDSHDGMHATKSKMESTLRPLFQFAKRQHNALGEFLLVLNVAAAEWQVKPKNQQEYVDVLSEGFGSPVSLSDIHHYTSSTSQMAWIALRYGF